MPTYEYCCENCGKVFSVRLSMPEHDQGNVSCPHCKGWNIVQQYTSFYAKTAKKS
jgi:putative FmdB family regulatory protein